MTEEERIAFNNNKIGLLDPSGTLHECSSWGHLDAALDIVENMDDVPAEVRAEVKHNRLEAEAYLQRLGWVIVRARDVYGMIGFVDDNDEVIHLSERQKEWLIAEYGNFPSDKRESVDELIDIRDRSL